MVICFCCFQDYFSLLYHPETIKSNGMQRPSLSSYFIVFETITVSFTIQRQSSPTACGDHHGHPLLLFLRLLQSPLPSSDNQVQWLAETIMVICFIYISKMTMSSTGDNAFIYISKMTMPSFTFRRRCRNLPFGGRVTRDSRVRVPRKEYAWSRHQSLFEENVGKTGKDMIYEL